MLFCLFSIFNYIVSKSNLLLTCSALLQTRTFKGVIILVYLLLKNFHWVPNACQIWFINHWPPCLCGLIYMIKWLRSNEENRILLKNSIALSKIRLITNLAKSNVIAAFHSWRLAMFLLLRYKKITIIEQYLGYVPQMISDGVKTILY